MQTELASRGTTSLEQIYTNASWQSQCTQRIQPFMEASRHNEGGNFDKLSLRAALIPRPEKKNKTTKYKAGNHPHCVGYGQKQTKSLDDSLRSPASCKQSIVRVSQNSVSPPSSIHQYFHRISCGIINSSRVL